MRKGIYIKIPLGFCEMSPEAQAAGIRRRMDRITQLLPKKRRLMVAGMVLSAVFVCSLSPLLADTSKADPVVPLAEAAEVNPTVFTVRVLGRDQWELSPDEAALVSCVVEAVAGGEPDLCKKAVAQSIRCASEQTGMTVEGVIGWGRYPVAETASEDTIHAVERVRQGYDAVDDTILWAYNPSVQSGEWHEAQEFVCQLGSMRFFQ